MRTPSGYAKKITGKNLIRSPTLYESWPILNSDLTFLLFLACLLL